MAVLSSQRNSSQSDRLFQFTQGIAWDARLAPCEVRVQLAWFRELHRCGHINDIELAQFERLFEQALQLMNDGQFPWRVQDEDIHMNLERFITDKQPSLGKKMQLGRSRNDLIATTLRLFVEGVQLNIQAQLTDLCEALLQRASQDIEIIIPGMTHLQHGQPLRLSHVFVAHSQTFARDLERLIDAQMRTKKSMPLGSAALAGTTLEISLERIASELEFSGPTLNSYDSVGDRDFMVETLDAFASIALHLSRLSEDIILWASTPIQLVKLPTAWSTGSSIMPNKRNPDVPELIRAKSTHIMAAATNAHLLIKGLPSSYFSDLHELKGVFLRSFDELSNCLDILPLFLQALKINPVYAQQLTQRGHILATEIADHLTAKGLPFREAYGQVAALVETAEKLGVQVHNLNLEQVQAVAPNLDSQFLKELTAEFAVERRRMPGGSAKSRVKESIDLVKGRVMTMQTQKSDNHQKTKSVKTKTRGEGREWELAEWQTTPVVRSAKLR